MATYIQEPGFWERDNWVDRHPQYVPITSLFSTYMCRDGERWYSMPTAKADLRIRKRLRRRGFKVVIEFSVEWSDEIRDEPGTTFDAIIDPWTHYTEYSYHPISYSDHTSGIKMAFSSIESAIAMRMMVEADIIATTYL